MAENKKNINFSETASIIKNTVSEMKSKNKKLFKVCIALVVFLVIVICGVVVTSFDSVEAHLVNAVIPNQLEVDDSGLVFYSEVDPEYNSESSDGNALNMFRCYYYPDNDTSQEKVYLGDDGLYYYSSGESKDVKLAFVIATLVYASRIISALKIAAVVIVVLLVVFAIFMWYRADEKRYKEAQARIKKIKKRSH